MIHQKLRLPVLWAAAMLLVECQGRSLASETDTEQRLRLLEQQNGQLQSQVKKQQELIESLSRRVAEIQTGKENDHDSKTLVNQEMAPSTASSRALLGNLHISGEGGVAFFTTGSEGFAPHSQFQVDEARLFLEAPIWNDVYFFGEMDLATRENPSLQLNLGELYLDFEGVSQLWHCDNQLNIRVGRMNVPFGEEYLTRYAINNPLISHSLSDLWGMDAGLELYGAFRKLSYIIAVQNGSGANGVQDFSDDKSVAGRVSYDPAGWLHLSVSGMRTGDLSPQQDKISAMWFGNGFFRSLGSPATTAFHANIAEGDASLRWGTGHLSAFGGVAHYGDNDPIRDNSDNVFYYSVEGVQDLAPKLYLAARFSDILAGDGFPIVGNGDFGNYFFNSLSVRLWRLSVGLGYRFSERLVIKTEYTLERGKEQNGNSRIHEDFFGTEAAFQF